MNKLFFVFAATAALAACDNSDHTLVQGGEKPEINTAGVVLPPSIAASKAYRCKDNSLVYLDWLSDGTARIKNSKDEAGTSVKVGEDGPQSVKGDAAATTVTINGKSCKA